MLDQSATILKYSKIRRYLCSKKWKKILWQPRLCLEIISVLKPRLSFVSTSCFDLVLMTTSPLFLGFGNHETFNGFFFFIYFDQIWNLPRFSTLNGKGCFPRGTLLKTTWWLHSSLVNNLTFFLDICTFNLRVPNPFSLLQVLEVTSISSLFPLPVQLDVLSYRLRNMLSCIYLLPNMV